MIMTAMIAAPTTTLEPATEIRIATNGTGTATRCERIRFERIKTRTEIATMTATTTGDSSRPA
jgi:hypothetical protein